MLESPTDDTSTPANSGPFDEFVLEPGYLAFQEELRCLILHTAQTAAPSREASAPAQPALDTPADFDQVHNGSRRGDGTDERDDQSEQVCRAQMDAVLTQGRRLEYLKNYIAEVSPWKPSEQLDMFDTKGAFTIDVPVLARGCSALLYSILALSARQLERKQGAQHSFDSLELYQEAIRLLNPLLQAHDLTVVPTCVILCCLEMMSASPRDWRRHLEGCAALFDAFGVNGFSDGLFRAVFWCYARMDLCCALISDGTQATLVPLHGWLPPDADPDDAASLFRQHRTPDMHANYAVFLCSKVCKLIADRTRHVELGEPNGCDAAAFHAQWLQLWAELKSWVQDRPEELVPVKTVESQPFPQILFVHWAGISSNQLFHTACIMLLGCIPRQVRLDGGHEASATWHAKRVCGISLTNPHHGCLNNAIQPLWIAGRLLSHRSEHVVLARLIRSIEATTGWATSWRVADLEATWGHKID